MTVISALHTRSNEKENAQIEHNGDYDNDEVGNRGKMKVTSQSSTSFLLPGNKTTPSGGSLCWSAGERCCLYKGEHTGDASMRLSRGKKGHTGAVRR